MKAYFVNEKFTDSSDPIHDMGIGGVNPKEKWEELYKPMAVKYAGYLLELKGKILKGKFRLNDNIDSKKYNVTTDRIKEIKYHGKHFIKEIDEMSIIFVDEEDKEYYYHLKDGEKFFVE
jgi:hypothetical protein